MKKFKSKNLPSDLVEAIKNPDPIEGEDIFIKDEKGTTLGIIIQPKAYEFFIRKIEEAENEIDSKTEEKYDANSKSLDDLLEENNDER